MCLDYTADELRSLDDEHLKRLNWKSLPRYPGRLLELHAYGELGNSDSAKLPQRPILCIDEIENIDETHIAASFSFPRDADEWPYDLTESLEMLFQDQLDQLVGFWGCRKVEGIGRALSSGFSQLHRSLDYDPGKTLKFQLKKRKWIGNSASGGGTAVFGGQITDGDDELMFETKNIIVGIVSAADIRELRSQYGGTGGLAGADTTPTDTKLKIPKYDSSTIVVDGDSGGIKRVTATQFIDKNLWPLKYHFRGDPVVPGNFGTHGVISLLKEIAGDQLGLGESSFVSLASKKFSGQVFEDQKQIRFELLDVKKTEDGRAAASIANLYLENLDGTRMMDDPIYTFKDIVIATRQ